MTTAEDIMDAAGVANPAKYIDVRDGLRAATLATDVIAMGPLAQGIDNLIWSYRHGVWTSDKHAVRTRTAELLGELYRNSHAANAESVIRGRVPTITCEPIGEIINFRNGLYLWQADMLREHSPGCLSTVQLAVDWDPEATCPEFDKFLSQVLPADMMDLIWEVIGYLMYSGNPLHRAVMLMGGGRNGKGTFLRVINALLGERNVSSVSLHSLTGNRFSTASLFGKIANVAGDIDGTYLESTAVFKNITGQDLINAEHKGRDPFDFTVWAVPVFSANKIPPSADVTAGYLSRWLPVPFPYNFTGREDRGLDARLQTKEELAGIAAKAVQALRTLMQRGDFELSPSALAAKEDFARRVDQVRTWVNECAELSPDLAHLNQTVIYKAYKAWAFRDGHKALKAGEFYDRLEAAGAERATIHGDRGFKGIRIVDHAGEGWPT